MRARSRLMPPPLLSLLLLPLLLAACGGTSPFTRYIEAGDVRAVRKLAARGEDVNAPDRDGLTPLMRAAKARQRGAALALIEAGADLESTGPAGTALRVAIEAGAPEIVRILLDSGARPREGDAARARERGLEAAALAIEAESGLQPPAGGPPAPPPPSPFAPTRN